MSRKARDEQYILLPFQTGIGGFPRDLQEEQAIRAALKAE
jgi:hypothetical protein